jgi:hypothetical protein
MITNLLKYTSVHKGRKIKICCKKSNYSNFVAKNQTIQIFLQKNSNDPLIFQKTQTIQFFCKNSNKNPRFKIELIGDGKFFLPRVLPKKSKPKTPSTGTR